MRRRPRRSSSPRSEGKRRRSHPRSRRAATRAAHSCVRSLIALRRVALETIDDPGLGGAERHPVVRDVLERYEKFLTATLNFRVELVSPVELGLEGVLADERLVTAPLAPQRGVALGDDPLAEVELAEVHEHFLDDGLVHEIDHVA